MVEADVQRAFVEHLGDRGWDVTTDNPDHTDLIAKRGAERIVAEVKGRTSEPGLDVDTMYGQLLRRMHPAATDETRYAVVVPADMRGKVTRVATEIRSVLGVEVWTVDDAGLVRVDSE